MSRTNPTPKIIDVAYRFHPVGQGLFASGRITHRCDHYSWVPPAFNWVYDCGTSSSIKSCLVPELDHLWAQHGRARGHLDLLTLSHFDSDHTNGLAELLERFTVDTLLLPLIPLWKRLELAFSDEVNLNADALNFYLNPVSYLLQRYPEQIRTIVLVPAPPPEAEPREREVDDVQIMLSEDGDLRPTAEEALQADQQEGLDQIAPHLRARVKQLAPGAALQLGRYWEFLPYNDMHLCPAPPLSFIAAVQQHSHHLLHGATTSIGRALALVALRNLYDQTFGNSGAARNKISLFLYAGPIGNTLVTEVVPSTFQRPGGVETKANINLPFSLSSDCRLAVLYTGDGFLNSSRSVQDLLNILGPERLAALTCLQVPHHGARGNWATGHAKLFSPDIAVFCSDPKRKSSRHPHTEVIDDFSEHAIVPVDKIKGAIVEGRLALA